MAKVTFSFDDWEGAGIEPTTIEVPVVEAPGEEAPHAEAAQ